jgi:hypothetical protein
MGLPDPHPDSLDRASVLRIRISILIRTKMSRIHNTGKNRSKWFGCLRIIVGTFVNCLHGRTYTSFSFQCYLHWNRHIIFQTGFLSFISFKKLALETAVFLIQKFLARIRILIWLRILLLSSIKLKEKL